MISEFPPKDLQKHDHRSSPPLTQSELSPTTETHVVTILEIDRLDLKDIIYVTDTAAASDTAFKLNSVQDGEQASVPPAPVRDDDFDDDVESFVTASAFYEDLEKPPPSRMQDSLQSDVYRDSSELAGAVVTEVMGGCPSCESSTAILTIEEDAKIKQESEQDAGQACSGSPALSFAEVAIRVASPYLPGWMTSPSLPSSALSANSRKQQVGLSLEPGQDQAIELVAPPSHIHRDRRRVDQERCISGEVVTHSLHPVVLPPPSVPTLGPLESYWKMLPSIRSVSMDANQDASTLYEGSIRSSKTYGTACHLSTRARMEDVTEEDCDETLRRSVDLPRRTVGPSFPPLSFQHRHHDHFNHHQNHPSAGAGAAERLSTVMVSTGKAVLGYLFEVVVPTTVSLAHRGATATMDVVNEGLQVSEAILQNTVLPRLFHRHHHSSSLEFHPPECNPQENPHLSSSLHVRSSTGNRLVVPELVHLRDHHRLTTDPGTLFQDLTASQRSRPRPCKTRRYPLQTIPGPDGLDPQIRRELEAQGLASLGLRDGTEGRGWRNWWDPRRYGLPKYVICHELRTPRPCTLILLAILVVCIVCK